MRFLRQVDFCSATLVSVISSSTSKGFDIDEPVAIELATALVDRVCKAAFAYRTGDVRRCVGDNRRRSLNGIIETGKESNGVDKEDDEYAFL